MANDSCCTTTEETCAPKGACNRSVLGGLEKAVASTPSANLRRDWKDSYISYRADMGQYSVIAESDSVQKLPFVFRYVYQVRVWDRLADSTFLLLKGDEAKTIYEKMRTSYKKTPESVRRKVAPLLEEGKRALSYETFLEHLGGSHKDHCCGA